jgi:phage tail-like protein
VKVKLADQLPACLAEDPFLGQFLCLLDEVAEGVEMQVAGLEHLVDSSVAPAQMIQWVGGFWLDAYLVDSSMPIDRQRAWLRGMSQLLWWRGTLQGLSGILRLATGREVEIDDSGGVYRAGEAPTNAHHVSIWVDEGGWTSDEHLLAVLHREIPAEVSFELQVGERVVWPRRDTGEK